MKRDNKWHFDTKRLVGIVAERNRIHRCKSIEMKGNLAMVLMRLLHRPEGLVFGDKAYIGQTTRIREAVPHAFDTALREGSRGRWLVHLSFLLLLHPCF